MKTNWLIVARHFWVKKGLFLSLLALSTLAANAAVFDVRSFGAKGDGASKDTVAVQRAVDAANAAGGGEVLLPKGVYLCGSVFLKSGVDFHLAAGAVLKGSPDHDDYNPGDIAPQNSGRLGAGDNVSGGHLLLCIEQENVTLRGPGRIDGNVGAFLKMPDGSHPPHKLKIPWRPGQMVWFVESRNIAIRDIELADAPYWSCFIHGCEDVTVERANIHTVRTPHTYNGDGLDIDSSRRVRVTGCNISTADDSLTLRADGARLKHDGDCADVTVSDCTFSSDCNAIRVGVGNGHVRDCSFRDIKIVNTRYAVNAVGAWSRPVHGVDISRISFENLAIEAKGFCKFYYKMAKGSVFDGITFRHVRGQVREPSIFDDTPERPFRNLRFEDVRLEGETSPRIANAKGTASVPGGAMAKGLTLTSPEKGATVPLLSEKQKAFMRMTREERAPFFDDKQPKKEKEIKRYRSEPRPVRLAWTGTGPFKVTVTKRGDAEPWFCATIPSNRVDVWNLEIGRTYDWTVSANGESAKGTFATEDLAPRLLRVPGVPNLRDMGGRVINGRRVRQGLVYRSSGLNNNAKGIFYTYDEIVQLEAEGKLAEMGYLGAKYSKTLKAGKELDRNYLRLKKPRPSAPGTARLTEEWREYLCRKLGIKTDIDLRSNHERFGMVGSPLGPDVKFVTLEDEYHGYAAVHKQGAEDTRRVLRVFLDRANYPIDFHCIGGADRTGTVATILHGILGLDDDEIWKDYQITAWQGGVNDAKHLGWFTKFVASFDTFEGATLAARIQKYVLGLGFTEKDIETIREIMFEPEAK